MDNFVNSLLPYKVGGVSRRNFVLATRRTTNLVHTSRIQGYKKNASGIFESPSGKPLSFSLQVVAGWSDWDEQADLIANELKQIGIQVTVHQLQQSAYTNLLVTKKYDLAMSWSNIGPTPYYYYENMLASNGGWNVEGLKSTVVDTALSNFEKTTNLSQQKKQIYQLEKYAAEQLPTIPLVNNAIWYEYSTAEYTGWPTKDNPYVDPSIVNNFTPAIIVSKLRPVSDQ